MAKAELVNKEEKKEWEPYLTLTLSRYEAAALRATLGAMQYGSPTNGIFDELCSLKDIRISGVFKDGPAELESDTVKRLENYR